MTGFSSLVGCAGIIGPAGTVHSYGPSPSNGKCQQWQKLILLGVSTAQSEGTEVSLRNLLIPLLAAHTIVLAWSLLMS